MERRNVFEDYIEMSVLPPGREPKIEILVNFITMLMFHLRKEVVKFYIKLIFIGEFRASPKNLCH